MNKAKMTFRFDPQGKLHKTSESQKQNIIPLQKVDYHIVEPLPQPENSSVEQDKANADASETTEAPSFHSQISDFKLIDAQSLNQYTTDFGGWQSSFDTETHRIEQLIRSSDGSHVNPETGYMGFGGNHREEELRDHRWFIPEQTAYYKKSSNGSWFKIISSVAGAVVTGVVFGFLVLSMFSGDSSHDKAKTPSDTVAATSGKNSGEAAGQAGKQPEPAAKAGDKSGNAAAVETIAKANAVAGSAIAVNLPAISYTFLQGGVFSSAQSAEAAASDFRKKGFAAVSEAGDKYPVFVGMALSRDDASKLSQAFQQKKLDVLLKTYDLPALSKIQWNGKQSDVFQNYIAQGDKLAQLILAQTIAHANDAKPGALDEKAYQAVKTAHQSWSATASAVNEGMAETGKASASKMNSALNSAVDSLEEYKKNPSSAVLWQAQSALMQYVVAEKELRKSIALQ